MSLKKINIEFKECPKCFGYGILDSGKKCKLCKGSGELMYDRDSGGRVTLGRLLKMAKSTKTESKDESKTA